MRAASLLAGLAATALTVLVPPPPAAHAGGCTGLKATRLPAGTLAPNGAPLSDPIGDWEQVAADCDRTVATVKVHVPDCKPTCAGPSRFIAEHFARTDGSAPCTMSDEPNFADTITCPGKGARVCLYLKKEPGPDTPVAISSETVMITFADATAPDGGTPALGAASPGCGIGDHPVSTAPPSATLDPGGGTVTCSPGTWAGNNTYSYEWFDGLTQVGTGQTYVIKAGDAGKALHCRVTATNAEGFVDSAESNDVVAPTTGGTQGTTGTTGGTGAAAAAFAPPTTTPSLFAPPPDDDCIVRKRALEIRFPFPTYREEALLADGATVGVGAAVHWIIGVSGRCPPDAVVTDVIGPGFDVFAQGDMTVASSPGGATAVTLGGGMGTRQIAGTMTAPGTISNVATVRAGDRAFRSNTVTVKVVATPKIAGARASATGASGTASTGATPQRRRAARAAQAGAPALRRVDVAIRRVQRGRCLWLRGRTAAFARSTGPCVKPRWLRATGTARWSYRLRKRLPAGRYELYVRATNAAGVSDGTFRPARGNLVRFVVP